MYGGDFHVSRSPGKELIYRAKTRTHYQNQSGQGTHHLPRAQNGVIKAHSTEIPVFGSHREPDNQPKEISEPVRSTISPPAALRLSNLESFLEAVTPSIPAQYLSKTRMRNMGTCDVEYRPYFVLADLWESFNEWSAYGAGAPLVLYDGESVVQYYVPYLSAIQIYTHPKSRKGIKNSEGECSSKGSRSDVNMKSEWERISTYINSHQYHHHQTTNISSKLGKLSLRDQKVSPQGGFSGDDSEYANSRGNLLFQYLEYDPPFTRGPFYEKISELAARFPELKSMRSCDLHPSSWFSVAWYPIYRIPTGPTMKDLDACFLTFHSLYTPIRATPSVHAPLVYPDKMSGFPKIALLSFGLSSYKFRGSMWTGSSERSSMLVNSLSNGANNWLRFLKVHHPDHSFFVSRR